MSLQQALNGKGNVKKTTINDIPYGPQQPVISSYYGVSTLNQTQINLSFSVSQSLTDQFFLFIDGKKLTLGSSNDYVFAPSAIDANGYCSVITLNSAIPANLNIQAYKLGLKPEIEFVMDSRFTALYEAEGQGFQGFINTQSNLITATTTTGSPAAGTFYSSISGRASITDLSQDLKPRMGIERRPIQDLYPITGEIGPNGETIFGVLNDTFGQVRLGGSDWQPFGQAGASPNGVGVFSNVVGDFAEFTFYGTGLNLLLYLTNSARTFTVTVDGVSTTSVSPSTTSTSTLLNGRNFNQNIVTNIVRGLTLGVHTVKVALSVGSDIDFTAWESINESANVTIPTGVAYLAGKKIASSAPTTTAYGSAVTGTRGGRVLTYLSSGGVVSQAFTAVGTQLNYPSADHTNEEIARVYSFREFGSGQSTDFSRINSSSAQNAAFILEDGSTILVGQNQLFNSNTKSGAEGLYQNTTNDYTTFTFVGTGLDLVNGGNGTGTVDFVYSIFVDGTSIATGLTGAALTSASVLKIVSGLPYGSHTVKLLCTSAGTFGWHLVKAIVYQPKTPSLPTGAIQLSTYNVLANYVANSTQSALNIAQGVLRKATMRECNLTGTWAFSSGGVVVPNSIMGWELSSPASASSITFQFFGTGFEYRAWNNTAATTYTMSIDGQVNTQVANNSPTGGAGWPSALTTSFYGTSFTYANTTGVVTLAAASGTSGCGISINGLNLGWHTITINWTSGTGSINPEAFDIITPIHSYKSNLYGDLQNTLPVGSTSLSDDRVFTPIAGLSTVKGWAQAIGASNGPAMSSTSPVPVPDLSCTIKTSGGRLRMSLFTALTSSSGNTMTLAFYVDGVQAGVGVVAAAISGNNISVSNTQSIAVAPGFHKIDVYASVTAATWTFVGTSRSLLVEEI